MLCMVNAPVSTSAQGFQRVCGKACAKLSNGRYVGRSHYYSMICVDLIFIALLKTLAFHMQFAPFFVRFVAILFQNAELAGISFNHPSGLVRLLVFQGPCVIS